MNVLITGKTEQRMYMLRMKKWTIKNISALDEFCGLVREEITIVFSTVLNKTLLKQQIFISLFCAQNFWQICTYPQQFNVQNRKYPDMTALPLLNSQYFWNTISNYLIFWPSLLIYRIAIINQSSSHLIAYQLSINFAQRIDFLRADRLQTW